MTDRIQERLTELRREFTVGEERLRELVRQETALRESLLRISGAIQILEELSTPPPAAPARSTDGTDGTTPPAPNGTAAPGDVLTVP